MQFHLIRPKLKECNVNINDMMPSTFCCTNCAGKCGGASNKHRVEVYFKLFNLMTPYIDRGLSLDNRTKQASHQAFSIGYIRSIAEFLPEGCGRLLACILACSLRAVALLACLFAHSEQSPCLFVCLLACLLACSRPACLLDS